MPGDAVWEINIDTETAKQQTAAAILQGVTEVFELDIKPEAIKMSPYQHGTNRRSIDTEVSATPEGVSAEIFTQSGYGGYLELGTVKMKARPYLYPAFNMFINKLKNIVRQKIQAIRPSMFIGPKRS